MNKKPDWREQQAMLEAERAAKREAFNQQQFALAVEQGIKAIAQMPEVFCPYCHCPTPKNYVLVPDSIPTAIIQQCYKCKTVYVG